MSEQFEIISDTKVETAILVGIITQEQDERTTNEYLDELEFLADTAGLRVLRRFTQKIPQALASTYVGKGKLEEIREYIDRMNDMDNEVGMAIFDDELTAKQMAAIENALGIRALDRTSLILDIFAMRAQTAHAKTQVEMAQYRYLLPRLQRMWTHLERQRGGFGFVGGPGETQIELDRRMIGEAIKRTKERLAKVKRQRQTQRRQRERRQTFNISLVGYTNAGKSSLFNALVKARAYAADQLFATLDTTTRRIWIEGAGQVVVSDTVGFIRELPHQLVEAFKATLEETVRADLLLHVVDASSPARLAQIDAVQAVLREIGADAIPQILVYNKADVAGLAPEVGHDACGSIDRVVLSALSGGGLDLLRTAIAERAALARHAREEIPDDAAHLEPTPSSAAT